MTMIVVSLGRSGKGAEALDPFWKRLRHSRAVIEAVAADMSPAYALAVRTHIPHATLVNDRFHVIKLYNELLTVLWRNPPQHAEVNARRHGALAACLDLFVIQLTAALDPAVEAGLGQRRVERLVEQMPLRARGMLYRDK